MSSKTNNILELKDIFIAHLSNQEDLKEYPKNFIPLRTQLLNWVINICQRLHFKQETLYRTISLFDQFISATGSKATQDISHYKLVIIACLSISTKINEVNANYIKFFTKNILNVKTNKLYKSSDIYTEEMEILSSINYCINSSTICQFNSIFTKICLSHFINGKSKQLFSTLNDKLLREYVVSSNSLVVSPVNGAILVMNATLNYFKDNEVNKIAVIASLSNLITNAKSLIKM